MKAYLLKSMVAVAAVALLASSCKKEDTPTPPVTDPYESLYKIAEMPATGSNLSVALYMDEEPFVGYNMVYAVVKDAAGKVVESANVDFMPMMDMGAMQHSCPLEQPMWSADDMAAKGAITFVMPSTAGSWTVKVMVDDPSSMEMGEATFPITVMAKPEAKMYSFTSAVDQAKIFVAIVQPKNPKVGMNDFEVVVYKRMSMMSWPAVSDLNIFIDPEMPTMGHGSPNNVDPVAMSNGHYMGKVNFTMTGYWKVNMMLKDAQNAMMDDQGFFDITF